MSSGFQMTRREFMVNGLKVSAGLSLAAAGMSSIIKAPGATGTTRIGIIGLGELGLRQLALCASLPAVEVRAICDTDDSALIGGLRQVRRLAHRQPESAKDFRVLLDRKDIDAILIATPVASRAKIVSLSREAGKHVYVEPPWAATVTESRDLMISSQGSETLIWQGSFDPAWDSNAIGQTIGTSSRRQLVKMTVFHALDYSNSRWRSLIDQFELARLLLDVDTPESVSALAHGAHSRAVFLEFNKSGSGKTALIQSLAMPAWPSGKTVIQVDLSESEEGEHLIESAYCDESEPSTTWNRFFHQVSTSNEQTRKSALERAHGLSSYLHWAEASHAKGCTVGTQPS